MSNQINDGTVQYGARELTIAGKGTFETDDFSWDEAVTDFTRTNFINNPTGQVYTKGKKTGKCTVQLPNGVATPPDFGDVFTCSPQPTDETGFLGYIVTKRGRAERKDGETKVPIEFCIQISNTLTVS